MDYTIADAIIAQAMKTPYFHLKDGDDIYMERYWLVKPDAKGGNGVRIHHTMRSDSDRALHDHPWASTSVILKGGFWEIMPKDQAQATSLDETEFVRLWRSPGQAIHRAATDRHRLELPEGQSCWTMFITGPWEKDWGFYDTKLGWIYWRDYLNDYTTVTASDSKTFV